jgi:hypothetical protein
MKHLVPVALGIVLLTAACDNSSSTTSPTTTPNTTTYNLSGVAPAAVAGIAQPDFKNFTVGQSGGTVSVLLLSAVETLVGGTLNPNVVVVLGLGSPSGATCVVPAGSTINLQAGASSGVSVTLNPGAYCVQITNGDASALSGPVAYTVQVTSP